MKHLISSIKKIPLEVKYIFCLFFCTRFILIIIGCLSHLILEPKLLPRKYVFIYSKHLWLDIWGVWDTGWYLDIATNGYSLPGTNPDAGNQANYAFFPLYPLLIKILGVIIGDNYTAGIILSNIFLIVACIFLYKLVCLKSDQDTALRSVKYLFLFPTAFIFSGVFTESLFLVLTLICFYYAKREQWLFVGIAGLFLSLTRVNGIFVILPLSYEYLKIKRFRLNNIRINSLYLLLIPFGLFIFASYNYYLTGDFLAFVHIQSAWHRHLNSPLKVLSSGLFSSDYNNYFSAYFTLSFLGVLIIYYKKLDFSYWIFGMYSILIPLSTKLESMPRYLLPVFPLYLIFAELSNNSKVDQFVTLSLALLQGFLMVFWTMEFSLII